MKRIVLLLAVGAMISFTACKEESATTKIADAPKTEMASTDASQSSDPAAFPEISFDSEMHDFGTVTAGDVVTHEFTFTNTGDAPLKVMQARPSCGCTVPDWSKDPIAPGDKGSVTVEFNSTGTKGVQNKSVRLTTNTKKGNEVIRFKATVDQ